MVLKLAEMVRGRSRSLQCSACAAWLYVAPPALIRVGAGLRREDRLLERLPRRPRRGRGAAGSTCRRPATRCAETRCRSAST